jgi:hypothetical protein
MRRLHHGTSFEARKGAHLRMTVVTVSANEKQPPALLPTAVR